MGECLFVLRKYEILNILLLSLYAFLFLYVLRTYKIYIYIKFWGEIVGENFVFYWRKVE
jgi:hypothetical protein